MTTATFPFWHPGTGQYVYGAARPGSMKQSGSWYYYLAYGLGSTMAIVDASSVVENSYTYCSHGCRPR